MQITNTSIRHKRYSTYGWNVKNEDNVTYRNILNQGEIGVLLCHKRSNGEIIPVTETNINEGLILNHILETRVGTKDGQYFFEAPVLNFEGFGGVKKVKSLPNFGNLNCLYIAESKNNSAYIWDNENGFVPIAGGNGNGGGGVSEEDLAQLLSNYVKKDELDNKLASYVTFESANQIHNSLSDRIDNVNNRFNNYYTSSEVDAKIQPINASVSNLNSAIASKADKSALTAVEEKIKALEGTTHFIGVKDELPLTANNGDICIVGNKEYVYDEYSIKEIKWVELGDTSAESERITNVENSISDINNSLNTINTNLTSKVSKEEVNTSINKVKEDLNSSIDLKTGQAETNAKLYADGLASNYDAAGTAASIKEELQQKIDSNTSNFSNYYNKNEVDDLISNSGGGGIGNIDEIFGGNAALQNI